MVFHSEGTSSATAEAAEALIATATAATPTTLPTYASQAVASPLFPSPTPTALPWHRMPRIATGAATNGPQTTTSNSTPSSSAFDVKIFAFSGSAACVAEACAFPIDTAKTRMQLQGQRMGPGFLLQNASAAKPYRHLAHCWYRICTEEGATVLYRGLSPALCRQGIYGTIKFGLYFHLKARLPGGEESLVKNVCCAMFAGSVSSAIATPFDVLKVRLQSTTARESVKQESNIAGRFADIFAREGVRGLWRGAGPTTTRAAVVAGAQLSTYDHAKATLIREGLLDDNFLNYLVSSAFAALCACLVSNPFDVVRTRLMNQRRLAQVTSETHAPLPPSAAAAAAPGQLIYRSSVHCLMFTVRTERVTALYKGFLPSLSRMLLWNLIFFQLYEWLKKQNVEQARSNCSDER